MRRKKMRAFRQMNSWIYWKSINACHKYFKVRPPKKHTTFKKIRRKQFRSNILVHNCMVTWELTIFITSLHRAQTLDFQVPRQKFFHFCRPWGPSLRPRWEDWSRSGRCFRNQFCSQVTFSPVLLSIQSMVRIHAGISSASWNTTPAQSHGLLSPSLFASS